VVDIDAVTPTSRRTWRRRFVVVAVAAALGLAVYTFRRPLFHGNFGVVEPGLVFRSAQPHRGFAGLIRTRGLASVLNLRGGSAADPWYTDEVRLTGAAGVDFYDFPMSATRRPSRAELLVLLDVFGRCRYPLLIHCKSGADRTGLATALYLMAVKSVAPERALGAFTLDYGHVPLGGPERLHEPLAEYAAYLKGRGLGHTPERLRRWVETEYAGDRPAAVRTLRPGPREALARGSVAR